MSPQRLLCIVPHCSVSPSEVSIDRPSLTAQMLPLPPRWQTTSFRSVLPIRAYCYSIKKYIGSYAAAMGGLDAIVFGGGIGLGSALVRALSLEGLEFLGVKLDGFKNRMAIAGMDISMEDAPVRVFTVHTDEEIIVARKAAALLQKQA